MTTQAQSVPFIPDNAPFTPAQRAWLNRFLAGMFSGAQSAGTPSAPANLTTDKRYQRDVY